MEEEHRRIISAKMKLAVHKKLHPDVVNPFNSGYEQDSRKDENGNKASDEKKPRGDYENPKNIQVYNNPIFTTD